MSSMSVLSFTKLNKIIEYSTIVKSNYDVNKIIYSFYKNSEPKYKKNECCIRNFENGHNQFVNIHSFTYNMKNDSYCYFYSYYCYIENLEIHGWCYEKNLRNFIEYRK